MFVIHTLVQILSALSFSSFIIVALHFHYKKLLKEH